MADVAAFTSEKRERIREELVAAAKADSRIAAAAHLGSAASGTVDRWSDIDLALSLAADADLNEVVEDWTTRLYRDHGAVANYDVRHGNILYRVFLLANTLQIDLSFWPSGQLRATGSKFSLIFGVAGEPAPAPDLDSNDLIGMAWLYALHVRSSIARSRRLQAEYMLSGMRDNVLALMCKRHKVVAIQGRGLDDLPEDERALAEDCLARSLEPVELKRAFRVTTDALLEELRQADSGVDARLSGSLSALVDSVDLFED
jgi:predicted nucleotidyltransferase